VFSFTFLEFLNYKSKKIMPFMSVEKTTEQTNTAQNTSKKEINAKETYSYDVEMNNLMSIIINSMYSSKDYFLRELISNCSDACDKLNALRQDLREKGVNVDMQLKMSVTPTEDTITVSDNGIGMTKDDLVKFLGCVANSGTRKFREAVKNAKGPVDDLIGQFGLGFYASFLVADKVQVVTKYPTEDKQYMWTSSGLGHYTVEEVPVDMEHGTRVVLHIKESCREFVKKEKIKELIKKYSMFIGYPIVLRTLEEKEVDDDEDKVEVDPETGEKVKVNEDEEKVKVDVDEEKEKVDEEKTTTEEKQQDEKVEVDPETGEKINVNEKVTDEEEKIDIEKNTERTEKPAKAKKLVKEWKDELINKEKPLWSMNPKDVTKEMYTSFYKTISNDWDDYLAVKHSHLEGSVSFDVLLFALKRPRFNMFSEKGSKKHLIRLYCNSVLVTEDLELPDWLSCVVGVISSKDLPMNVSREFLQGENVKRLIKKTLRKKTIEMLKEMNKETYDQFYKEFSGAIKLAVRDDNEQQLESLLRFNTSKRENIGLDDYVKDMKEGQNKIYVITGTTKEEVVKSPFLEYFKDYEVIFMIDSMDEYLLQRFRAYKGNDVVKINQEGVDIPNAEVSKEMQDELKALKENIEKTLGDSVERVEFLNLGDKHMLVRSPKYSISPAMEKILAAQVAIDKSNMFMFPKGKKILQVNVTHPLTLKLNSVMSDATVFAKLLNLLFKVACLQCGYALDDPVGFADMVSDVLMSDRVEKVVEEEEVH
ncbi:Molecular chaperone (HSP90 family), partial [Trachipleistophora hominis]